MARSKNVSCLEQLRERDTAQETVSSSRIYACAQCYGAPTTILAVPIYIACGERVVSGPCRQGMASQFVFVTAGFRPYTRMRGDVGSIVMCISPLTALMMEQRSVRGISSEYICLQQDIEAMDRVRKGMVQLLYVSPESILSNPQWRDMLLLPVYQKNFVALVVDEAHCITMW